MLLTALPTKPTLVQQHFIPDFIMYDELDNAIHTLNELLTVLHNNCF